ncbi:hypothetical protein KY290_027642 [Solanum tuberosum]|uniref:Uncharacterized protein n=1 Tax=Solanum tuberosum TaxID=4113 RepID=A0ABQ7UFM8_SOLTU|nr:hypothetical protein KY289_026713 [Solanum tuberosum]KAH0661579.1 hypothetical protein KY284_026510 [Solanum tuberosum]KAH0665394.1 hypothetical protein KY285_026600 [Solanum tuberosum]KAH0748410.1 hypothetical protein KY290_027642 [Solanum tuberosum]
MRSLQNIKVNESLGLKAEAAMRLRSSSLLNNTREDKFLHSFANRSFFSKELKKQIIDERWKATQDIEVGYRNHTLGDTNALAELEARPQCMDSKHEKQCFSHIRSSCSCSPSCISSKDGSKYEHSRISPLDSRVTSGSLKNNIGNKASKYGSHLRKKENVDGKDSKLSYLKQKVVLECRDLSFILDQYSSGSISPCISSTYIRPAWGSQ